MDSDMMDGIMEPSTSTAASATVNEEDGDRESAVMEPCVNCCQAVTTKSTTSLDLSMDSVQISSSLSTIYKLHHLAAFMDNTSTTTTTVYSGLGSWNWNSDAKLCGDCMHVFLNLWNLYQDFNNLRTFESCLAKEIQKLDNCIQAQEIIRKIKKEPFVEQEQEEERPQVHHNDISNGGRSRSFETFQCANDDDFADDHDPLDNNHCDGDDDNDAEDPIGSKSANVTNAGPWIVLQKLENDPAAQSAIALSTRSRTKSNKRSSSQKANAVSRKTRKIDGQSASSPMKIHKKENIDDEDDEGIDYVPSPEENKTDSDFNYEKSDDEEGESYAKSKKRSTGRRKTTATSSKKKSEGKVKRASKRSDSKASLSKSATNKNKSKTRKTTAVTKVATKSAKGKPRGKYKVKAKAKKGDVLLDGQPFQSINGRVLNLEGTIRERRETRKRSDKAYRRRKTKVANPCWYCDLDFPTQKECYDHTFQEHFETGHYICKDCSNLSATRSSFSFHQKYCHTLSPGKILIGYTCDRPDCDYSSPFKYYVDNHMLLHEVTDFLLCTHEGCEFKTKNPFSLRSHIRSQHPEKELTIEERTCVHCGPGRIFKTKISLQSHLVKMHTDEGVERYKAYQKQRREFLREKTKTRIANRSTACSICNLELYTNLALVYHNREFHGSDVSFVCDQCGSGFKNKTGLAQHVEFVHTDLRRFSCDRCGKSFKNIQNCRDHMRATHTEEGRLAYNARMRLKNARRKIRRQAEENLKKNSMLPTNIEAITTMMDNNQHQEPHSSQFQAHAAHFAMNPSAGEHLTRSMESNSAEESNRNNPWSHANPNANSNSSSAIDQSGNVAYNLSLNAHMNTGGVGGLPFL